MSLHDTHLRHAAPVLGVPAANSAHFFTSGLRGGSSPARGSSPASPAGRRQTAAGQGGGGSGGASSRVLRGTIQDVKAALVEEGAAGATPPRPQRVQSLPPAQGEAARSPESGAGRASSGASPLPKAGALWGSVFQRGQGQGGRPGSASGSPEASLGAAAALLSAAGEYSGGSIA